MKGKKERFTFCCQLDINEILSCLVQIGIGLNLSEEARKSSQEGIGSCKLAITRRSERKQTELETLNSQRQSRISNIIFPDQEMIIITSAMLLEQRKLRELAHTQPLGDSNEEGVTGDALFSNTCLAVGITA